MRTNTKIVSIITALMIAGTMNACNVNVNIDTDSSQTSATASNETASNASTETASQIASQAENEAASTAASESASEIESESADEEDSQNPVMNFVGPYACDRAAMEIQAQGDDEAVVTVTWSNSAFSHAEWTMSGSIDSDTLTVYYYDCTKSVIEYDENGSLVSDETEYDSGTGRIVFHEDGTVTWEDDQEKIADGMVFTFNY